ncbi:MAG: nucleotide exchange factor GrpE [Flavobacteriales bacterium]|nr:nucleotide exchange factor GrpE [Flavobacteriales bacterium]
MSVAEEKNLENEESVVSNEQELSNESDLKEMEEREEVVELSPDEINAKLEAEIVEQKDKFVRLYSEFENFRRRSAKEKIELISNAGEKIMADLLPILDDLERAIKINESVEDATAIKEGVNLVFQKFNNVLKAKGLEEIKAQNQDFDVDFHEAITKIPAPSPDLKNKVVDVVEKGYKINDKVIRYAKVVIGE